MHAAQRGGFLARKGLEDMLLELFAHADAVVGDGELLADPPCALVWILPQRATDAAAVSGVLDRVAQQVDRDLRRARLVEVDVGVLDFLVDRDGMVFALGLCGHHHHAGVEDRVCFLRRLFQHDLARLDARELEDVVEDGEHAAPAHLNLAEVVPHELGVVDLLLCQLRETEYGAHGRADVVRHVEEEARLGSVGLFCTLHGNGCLALGQPRAPQQHEDHKQNDEEGAD